MTGRAPRRSLGDRIHDNGLFLVTAALFVVFLVGTALSGWNANNADLAEHGAPVLALGAYLGSAHFGEAIFENWESEFLQMGMYVVLTIFLVQRGSSESKKIGSPAPQDADPRRTATSRSPWPVRHGGWVLVLYENSMALLFGVLFVLSFALHAVTGAAEYSQDQLAHGQPAVTAGEYLGTAQFWFESMQNWQSEFLVVAVIVVASIYLRQRGSNESKPVAVPHDETGS